MIKNGVYFGLGLILVLTITGGLHYAYLNAHQLSIPLETLLLSYLVNLLMALGIYITLLRLARQKSQYLGFVFLFGSAFKFIVYFLVFDPLFKQDGDLSKTEFFTFFVPYLISLIAETIALVNLLRTIR